MDTRHAIVGVGALGELTLVATGPALVGVYFPGHWTRPDPSAFGPPVSAVADLVLGRAARELGEYLGGRRTSFEVPTAWRGTSFDERVWALLRELPFGSTTTYAELAERLGSRSLARMVGRSVGRNPLSIVVGCHRVLGSGGELRGYAGGLDRKRLLLALEAGQGPVSPARSLTIDAIA